MKIAILGGSFDPPHKGHICIASRLSKLCRLDRILLMPCRQHPFSKNLSAPDQRLEMARLLQNDKIKVSDLEIKRRTISYSIDTLRHLSGKHPKDKFYWIIGADQIKSFTKWKQWKEIINNYKLIIVPRTAAEKAEEELKNIVKQAARPENIFLIDKKTFPPIHISSTLIRKKIKEKKPISDFVPKEIEKYIMQNKLYK